jgi:aminopeptidase-like protein
MNTSMNDDHATASKLLQELWPIMRSITGDGVRETHDILSKIAPLHRYEIPSGTEVFDWTVPQEWRFRDAFVIDPNGRKILDAKENTLHLVNYAAPFEGIVPLEELQTHLYSLPDRPQAIPYVTSYYKQRWGFCIADELRKTLPQGDYKVVVDTEHFQGSMTLSEIVLPGESEREVFFSTYTCHTAMANNELSGPVTAILLARRLAGRKRRRFTYRFAFLPETIGAIAYLHKTGTLLKARMAAGFVVTCTGLLEKFTYQKSRDGNTAADIAAQHALAARDVDYQVREFQPAGSDERQYCSPGFNLPVGSLMRGPYHIYPQYHTSDDSLDLLSVDALIGSVDAYEAICDILERNRTYETLNPHCEPFLSKHNLYPSIDAATQRLRIQAMLWLLNQSDSSNDLIAISQRSGIDIGLLSEQAILLEKGGLLRCLD